MENLLFLIFVLVSAAVAWLQKRRQQKDETSWEDVESPPESWGQQQPSPPAGSAPQPAEPPRKKRSWEEELRRLLEGESSPRTPPERPKPAPAEPERTVPSRGQQPAPRPRPAPATPPPMPVGTGKSAPTLARQRGITLQEAEKEVEKLKAQAAKHLQNAPETARRRTFPQVNAVAMLKHSHSIRQAFIASVILGPPKALDETLGPWASR